MHQIPSTYSSPMNTNLQFPEHEHLNCPRCDSDNTKFCYYNNYNLSQPRHYCKNCRRYWTKGGTLRKIPIGGGVRKTTKRSSTSNKRPADSSPPTAPPPPVPQLKTESSPIFDFNNNNQSKFGRFVDGSEKGGLNRTAGTDVFQVNYLGVNNNNNNNNSDNNQSGESSGCDVGGNGWPHLSIFTSGSSFR